MLSKRRLLTVPAVLVWLVAATVLVGCGTPIERMVERSVEWIDERPQSAAALSSYPWFGDRFVGVDVWEVVICRVPVGVADPTYEPSTLRLESSATEISGELDAVVDYFERWSRGRYRPVFRAGSDVSIDDDESNQDCVDRALDVSASDVDGVLVVADAQHRETVPGGWGRPGRPCVMDCPASLTRRAVYVGAADFMAEESPPLDLVEHEMGHALDWPHSNLSDDSADRGEYDSPFDLMSDSSAGRNADATVRHAPGPLAIHLHAAGWLAVDEVVEVDSSVTVDMVPADSVEPGVRLIVVPLGDSFWTVEAIADRGDNAHLDRTQVVVHRVNLATSAETGVARRQTVVASGLVEGSTHAGDRSSVTVTAVEGERWTIRVELPGREESAG